MREKEKDKKGLELLTFRDVARLLAVSPSTIRLWTVQRRLPSIQLGGNVVRYKRSDIERLIKAGARPALLLRRTARQG